MQNAARDSERRQSSPTRTVRLSTFFYALILVAVVCFLLGTRGKQIASYIGPVLGWHTDSSQIDLDTTAEVYHLLQEHYDGSIDTAKLEDGASQGMVAALGDPFTIYMTKDEATDFSDALGGRVSGVGAEIGVRNNQPTILRVIDHSPAQAGGLQPGDQIAAVNGKSTVGKTAEATAKLIRGETGTSVKVTLNRDGKSINISMTRANVSDPSVRFSMKGDVGILTMSRFDTNTGELARRAAEKLKSKGAKSIILDLRDDGGGELEQTGPVVGLWVGQGKTVVTTRRDNKIKETVTTSGEPILKGMPTIVLINGNTASAAEIVTGALHDYGAAKTLGEKSFGKGTVQQLFELGDGRELKVTIARWYTPNGKNINKTGFKPDYAVTLSHADQNQGRDPQLDAAMKRLR